MEVKFNNWTSWYRNSTNNYLASKKLQISSRSNWPTLQLNCSHTNNKPRKSISNSLKLRIANPSSLTTWSHLMINSRPPSNSNKNKSYKKTSNSNDSIKIFKNSGNKNQIKLSNSKPRSRNSIQIFQILGKTWAICNNLWHRKNRNHLRSRPKTHLFKNQSSPCKQNQSCWRRKTPPSLKIFSFLRSLSRLLNHQLRSK